MAEYALSKGVLGSIPVPPKKKGGGGRVSGSESLRHQQRNYLQKATISEIISIVSLFISMKSRFYMQIKPNTF